MESLRSDLGSTEARLLQVPEDFQVRWVRDGSPRGGVTYNNFQSTNYNPQYLGDHGSAANNSIEHPERGSSEKPDSPAYGLDQNCAVCLSVLVIACHTLCSEHREKAPSPPHWWPILEFLIHRHVAFMTTRVGHADYFSGVTAPELTNILDIRGFLVLTDVPIARSHRFACHGVETVQRTKLLRRPPGGKIIVSGQTVHLFQTGIFRC